MKLLNRKSKLERLLEMVSDSLDAANVLKTALPDSLPSGKTLTEGLPSGKSVKAVVPRDKALKAGLVAAGGLAGLTAGSAGISSLRRRQEGAADNSRS